MSTKHSATFVMVLLYSNFRLKNELENNTFYHVIKSIKQDKVLSRMIRCICIDHHKCRNVLRFNTSNTQITNFPVFAIRYPGSRYPLLYPICYFSSVFEKAKEVHGQYVSCIKDSKSIKREKKFFIQDLTTV